LGAVLVFVNAEPTVSSVFCGSPQAEQKGHIIFYCEAIPSEQSELGFDSHYPLQNKAVPFWERF